MSAGIHYRRVLIDGVQIYELLEFSDEHDNGNGVLSVTVKFHAKKIEIDDDSIRITSFKPADKS